MAAGIHLLMGLPTVLESRCPCWPSSNFCDMICLLKDRHVQHGTSSSVTPLSSVYTFGSEADTLPGVDGGYSWVLYDRSGDCDSVTS
jgi:hypothetical protein